MRKFKLFFFLLLLSLPLNQFSIAQNSDAGPDTKYNVKWNYGLTSEESAILYSNQNISGSTIPNDLLNQIENARIKNNQEEVIRLTDQMHSKYLPNVKKHYGAQYENSLELPVPMDNSYLGELTPDWLDGDVLAAVDTGGGFQFSRTLDLKRGDDGALYMAYIVNTTNQRRIKVIKSTDGGQTWQNKGGVWYPSLNQYFETLSMSIESKNPTIDDSLQVIVYYTHAAENNNDNAGLGFFIFKPNDPSFSYITKYITSPSSGREFNYVSAVSDGQYYNSATYFGCLVGEYSNNGDTTVAHHLFQTRDWGATHNSIALPTTYNDWFPRADFLRGTPDSIIFVTQRHFTTPGDEIRVMTTSWTTLSGEVRTNFLTVDTVDYFKPVISVKQNQSAFANRKMIITSTKDGKAVYHSSVDGGQTWTLNWNLDNRSDFSHNTNYTFVSSDSTGSVGEFCAMFSYRGSGDDSINVRRGVIGSMGSINFKLNSNEITSTHPAVTAIYRDGGNLYSTFAYWGNGPENIYFDSEKLITGIDNNSEKLSNYLLQQNYPNPFNPNTKINFSIPEQTIVKLKIFNAIGQEVATILNTELAAGNHTVDFNAASLSSGVYFYRIESPNFTSTKKMILMK